MPMHQGLPSPSAIDLVGQRRQLVPRRGHGIAAIREGLDRIPHDRLDVHLVGHGPDGLAGGVQRQGGRVLGSQLLGVHDGGDVHQQAGVAVLLDGGRLCQHDEIRRRAAVERHVDKGLVLTRGDFGDRDVDAGGRLEDRKRGSEVVALAADPLGLHRDAGALEGLVSAEGLVELGVPGRDRRNSRRWQAPPERPGRRRRCCWP